MIYTFSFKVDLHTNIRFNFILKDCLFPSKQYV